MPAYEFVGQSAKDSDNPAANTSRLVNCFREPIEGGHQIKSVLSEADWVDLSNVFLRDMIGVSNVLYAACGGALYSVTPTGTITNRGTISDGETVLSTNNGDVTVAANGTYYVWDGSTLSTPSTGAFSSVGSVTFLDQYSIITERGGRRFGWSAVADASSFNALHFATKEARDDDVLRAAAINGRLFLFGEQSTEIWYNTGQAGANAFQRVPGGVLDTGLKAFGLLAQFDQGAFFVGDDGVAYLIDGGAPRPVSTPAIETALAQGSPTRCFYYEDEGHKFCVIRFTDRPAWVFDLSTLEWHERGKGVTLLQWDAVASVKIDGSWRVGNDLGTVRTLNRGNVDGTTPLRRMMVGRTLYFEGERPTVAEFEIYAKRGYADLSATLKRVKFVTEEDGTFITDEAGNYVTSDVTASEARAPSCWIRVSKDEGNTWSREKSKSLGARGDYDARAIWRAMGQFRQFTVELNCTEPADIPFRSRARVTLA